MTEPSNKTLLASAVRTATQTLTPIANQGWSAALIFLSTTVAPAETLTVSVEAQDPASGTYVPYVTFAATASAFVGTKCYVFGAGAVETTAAADVEVQGLPLPGRFRVKVTHSASGNWTYTLGVSLLP